MENISIAIINGVKAVGAGLESAGVLAVVDGWEASTRALLAEHCPKCLSFETWLLQDKHPYHDQVELPLMNIFHVLLLSLGYLVGIRVLMLLMSFKKEGFKLKTISMIHNFILVCLSLFMFTETLIQAFKLKYSLFGNYAQNRAAELPMVRIIWIFYFSKTLEWGDTVIMVLKKNYHQVSFLHQYHHVSIFVIWFIVTWTYPCGEGYFSCALNSLVHVVMYSYYLMSALKIPFPISKFWITYFQMGQFISMMIQAFYDVWILKVDPDWLLKLLFYYMISLLILFGNFLLVNKGKKKGKKAKSQ